MASGDKQVKIKGQPHRWAKGTSGNLKGRPRKEHTLVSLLKEELEKAPKLTDKGGKKNTKTWAQLLAEALPAAAYKALLKGDTRPYALILERVEGKVPQALTGQGGGPLKTEFVSDETMREIRDYAKRLVEGNK
jgi:hypothetical protein